ncbi:MAG: site-specific DNA-methyltransferase [Gloeotrichia echinulata HAB0833]
MKSLKTKPSFKAAVEWYPLDKIIPYPTNSKKHPPEQITKLVGMIAEFGWDVPIVVDENGVILKGHGRQLAASRMELKEVPVIVRRGLSEAQKKAIRIADNKVAESPWDDEFLKVELEALAEMDFDLKLTGFDEEDWSSFTKDGESEFQGSQVFGDGTQQERDEEIAQLLEDAENSTIELRCKAGELWQLGKHRLIVGDSTNAQDVGRLMGGGKAAMVWTDPPYNVDYDPEERQSTFSQDRKNKPLGKIANDKMTDSDFRAFLDKVYSRINESLEAGCPIYISHADTMGHHFRNAFIAQPWKLQSCLIWKKTVLCFGRADYHWMHEPILYGWKEGASHRYYGDRKQTTILEFATAHYDKGNCDTDGYVHPTQKPTTLIEACINNSSQPGDIVLDLFGGSGSTLIACQNSGRIARLSEIDPKFATVIINRWEKLTGGTAVLVNSL